MELSHATEVSALKSQLSLLGVDLEDAKKQHDGVEQITNLLEVKQKAFG